MYNHQHLYDHCVKHKYRYVGIKTHDGEIHDGFICEVDQESVTLAIPTGEMEESMRGKSAKKADFRQFHGGFRRRRFFHRRIPFGAIAGLSLLPFFGAAALGAYGYGPYGYYGYGPYWGSSFY